MVVFSVHNLENVAHAWEPKSGRFTKKLWSELYVTYHSRQLWLNHLHFVKHLSSSLKMNAEIFVGLHVKSLHFPYANVSLLSVTLYLKL